jgi:hypothetical protein
VPRPTVDQNNPPNFDGNQLHKKKNANKNKVTIYGTNLSRGDSVTVTGTLGNPPTIWNGTIFNTNQGGTRGECKDLDVIQEQGYGDDDEKGKGAGPEDVSTTVTNGAGTSSPPVTTQNVVTVP